MNTFQKIVSMFLMVISLSIGYYFFVALPEHNQMIADIKKQELQLQMDIKNSEQQLQIDIKNSEQQLKEAQFNEERVARLREDCNRERALLQRTYDNVHSVYFNEYREDCRVRYYDQSGEIQESRTDTFGPIREIKPLYGHQTIIQTVNFRTSPSTSAPIIQQIDPTNIVDIVRFQKVGEDLRYKIQFYGQEGRIHSVAFGQR